MDFHEMFTEGCIGEFYGKEKFVRIYPLFSIDRVKFSFIQKGTGGVHLDIYVKLYPDFKNLMLDALGKRRNLYLDIQADNSPYPSARKYVSGDSGQNNLAIGKGQSGNPVIQGRSQDAGNYMIPFSYEELQETAYWFFKLYAYRPVPDEKVPFLNQEEKLCQRFWAFYYANAQAYHPDTVPALEALDSSIPEKEEKRGGRQKPTYDTAEEEHYIQPNQPQSGKNGNAAPGRGCDNTASQQQVITEGVFSDLKNLQPGKSLTLSDRFGAFTLFTKRKGQVLQIVDGNGKYIAATRLQAILSDEITADCREELYKKYTGRRQS